LKQGKYVNFEIYIYIYIKRERERLYLESENRGRGMEVDREVEVEVEGADLGKGDARTLDLMADLMEDMEALLTNLLQAEAIE
jgi:hypothetical protein